MKNYAVAPAPFLSYTKLREEKFAKEQQHYIFIQDA